MRIETTILKNLLHDEDYARKVVPHLREEYFQDKIERAIASQILKFFIKFNKPASVNCGVPHIVGTELPCVVNP